MKQKTIKRLARSIRRSQSILIGGNPQAAKLWREASQLRYANNLCLCSDDSRVYGSPEEAAADKSPAVICPECNRPKLRLDVIANTESPHWIKNEDILQLGLQDLLK